jgi:hypothetical protein
MTNSEWRVLPVLRGLPDELGMMVFVLVHVPLFALVVALVAGNIERTLCISRLGLAGFLVAHAAAHFLFSDDPRYEFNSVISNGLIYGSAVFGTAYLLLSRQEIIGLTGR